VDATPVLRWLLILLVDGNNVMGAAADGWWRDRPAAVRRLLARLVALATVGGEPITLVLDVPQPDLPEGDHDGVRVVYATRRGRDAADDRIRELATAGDEVVTSDRALRADLEAAGATVVGAGSFLRRLSDAGC
jgi:predicted RNA-binding protein with PIN domain